MIYGLYKGKAKIMKRSNNEQTSNSLSKKLTPTNSNNPSPEMKPKKVVSQGECFERFTLVSSPTTHKMSFSAKDSAQLFGNSQTVSLSIGPRELSSEEFIREVSPEPQVMLFGKSATSSPGATTAAELSRDDTVNPRNINKKLDYIKARNAMKNKGG
jgi:hypothetical protein